MPTLEQQARAFDNDYGSLEAAYRDQVGAELVTDPYRSPFFNPPHEALSASVIIPAWNAAGTLSPCLTAIEHSSFNRRYPDRLEVIVVDDGSIDSTWDLLSACSPSMRFTAVRQRHFSRAHAQNTGIALATGNVIIACDADMVLGTFAIEELVKRHQVIGDAMLLGFRADIAPDDHRISASDIAAQLPILVPPFDRDIRLDYGAGAWPDNMCRDTDHLKELGRGREIIMSDGGRWDLPGMVYGALFSMLRPTLQAMDGYEERFHGWGCEDTLIGARALAMGVPIVPTYSATGWHIAHGDRSPRKWQEFAANRRAYRAIVASPFRPGEGHYLARARDRIVSGFERTPNVLPSGPDMDAALNALQTEMNDASRWGKVLHALGRYSEAAEAFAQVQGSPRELAWAAFDRGKALRAAGAHREAVAVLSEVTDQLPDSAWPLVELGSALAGCGDFFSARATFEAAAQRDPGNPVVAHVLGHPASRHVERGVVYARQGHHVLAMRDFEAALIVDCRESTALVGRASSLLGLGHARAAQSALEECLANFDQRDPHVGFVAATLVDLHLASSEIGPAVARLEAARRAGLTSDGLAERMAAIDLACRRLYPLPLIRTIVERAQLVPGWFEPDELELLIALAMYASGRPRAEPTVIAEIGAFCGRATLAVALALNGIGRSDARIVAVDEPSLGLAPDGRLAADVLSEVLDLAGVGHMVIRSPAEERAPWALTSQLLLLDGRHDRAGLEDDLQHYLPSLAPSGLLVFHDYADYFPDVQQIVDDLLLDGSYVPVGRASSLIALARAPARTPESLLRADGTTYLTE